MGGHAVVIGMLIITVTRGVARANRSIRIISARVQGAAQGPQWVQGKALVGGPGGKAPGSSWILPDLHTSEPVCVSVFCFAYSSLSVFLRSGRICRRWI